MPSRHPVTATVFRNVRPLHEAPAELVAVDGGLVDAAPGGGVVDAVDGALG
ncbi:hypothetical protein [Streptomyces sp. NPDC051921]|uniref:hypothetical protein n=1 Tax=Streptomyces sp. NPDC051921 TaxID=3155806 RepID=UPI0034234935